MKLVLMKKNILDNVHKVEDFNTIIPEKNNIENINNDMKIIRKIVIMNIIQIN